METCTSKAKNVKTWTQLLRGASQVGDSNAAWQNLSAVVHSSFKAFDGGEVHVPSTLPSVQTRFLIRLYQGQGYTVKILLVNGTLRDPTAGEVKTLSREQDDDQPELVEQKRGKKGCPKGMPMSQMSRGKKKSCKAKQSEASVEQKK